MIMNICDIIGSENHSKMPRLFVIFRTFDRIWDSAMFTREFSPVDMDTSAGEIRFIFQTDRIGSISTGQTTARNICALPDDFYIKPHRRHVPIFFGKHYFSLQRKCQKSVCCQPISMNSFSESDNLQIKDRFINQDNSGDGEKLLGDIVSYFVLPTNKCTIIMDAHVASCVHAEFNRSRTFRQRFFHKIRRTCGFRDCTTDYEKWTAEERDSYDNYLSLPFMIDVITVWPWQKIDHGWMDRILTLVNKYVLLEESLAWLSTLGGAHSSLGETFINHAEKAGEISMQQLKLAKELGNEIMIARCYLYWAWSLLQRDYLAKCKICILHIWKYVKKIKCSDKILTNMCKAVWSRLQYKRSLVYHTKVRCSPGTKDSGYDGNTDGSGCAAQRKGGDSQYNESIKQTGIRMQPVEVC